MPRFLVCKNHRTVDTLPDYDTANDVEGQHDYHLRDAINRHLSHYGGDPGQHNSYLMRITEDEYDLIDPSKLKQAALDGSLEEYLKGERDMYKEDALRCYELHNRPAYGYGLGCADFHDSSRAIGRSKGIPDEEKMYICDFCPYNSYVEHAKHKATKFA